MIFEVVADITTNFLPYFHDFGDRGWVDCIGSEHSEVEKLFLIVLEITVFEVGLKNEFLDVAVFLGFLDCLVEYPFSFDGFLEVLDSLFFFLLYFWVGLW